MNKSCVALASLGAASITASSMAFTKSNNDGLDAQNAQSIQFDTNKAPDRAPIDSGFSTDGGSMQLVVKAIHSGQGMLRLAAYALASPSVVRALLAA